VQWYYVQSGQAVGPFDDTAFGQLVEGGTVQPDTLVWHPDLPDWQPWSETAAAFDDQTAAPCVECGRRLPLDQVVPFSRVYVCGDCKPVFALRVKQGTLYPLQTPYATFGGRALAKIADFAVVGMFQGAVSGLVYAVSSEAAPFFTTAAMLGWGVAGFFLPIVYNTFFIGRLGATPGKMALGIRVTLPDGGEVSYLRALARAASEKLSQIVLYIGYLTPLLDEERRALHDFICETRVVRAEPAP